MRRIDKITGGCSRVTRTTAGFPRPVIRRLPKKPGFISFFTFTIICRWAQAPTGEHQRGETPPSQDETVGAPPVMSLHHVSSSRCGGRRRTAIQPDVPGGASAGRGLVAAVTWSSDRGHVLRCAENRSYTHNSCWVLVFGKTTVANF